MAKTNKLAKVASYCLDVLASGAEHYTELVNLADLMAKLIPGNTDDQIVEKLKDYNPETAKKIIDLARASLDLINPDGRIVNQSKMNLALNLAEIEGVGPDLSKLPPDKSLLRILVESAVAAKKDFF